MNVTQHRLPMGVGRGDCGPPLSGHAVMCATQHHLPMGVGRGDYGPPPAGTRGWWSRVLVGRSMPSRIHPRWYQHSPVNNAQNGPGSGPNCLGLTGGGGGRRYRLGCRARSFLTKVHLPVRESGVRGREPPGGEITEQVISRGEWYLRVGLSLLGTGRMLSASAGEITI